MFMCLVRKLQDFYDKRVVLDMERALRDHDPVTEALAKHTVTSAEFLDIMKQTPIATSPKVPLLFLGAYLFLKDIKTKYLRPLQKLEILAKYGAGDVNARYRGMPLLHFIIVMFVVSARHTYYNARQWVGLEREWMSFLTTLVRRGLDRNALYTYCGYTMSPAAFKQFVSRMNSAVTNNNSNNNRQRAFLSISRLNSYLKMLSPVLNRSQFIIFRSPLSKKDALRYAKLYTSIDEYLYRNIQSIKRGTRARHDVGLHGLVGEQALNHLLRTRAPRVPVIPRLIPYLPRYLYRGISPEEEEVLFSGPQKSMQAYNQHGFISFSRYQYVAETHLERLKGTTVFELDVMDIPHGTPWLFSTDDPEDQYNFTTESNKNLIQRVFNVNAKALRLQSNHGEEAEVILPPGRIIPIRVQATYFLDYIAGEVKRIRVRYEPFSDYLPSLSKKRKRV